MSEHAKGGRIPERTGSEEESMRMISPGCGWAVFTKRGAKPDADGNVPVEVAFRLGAPEYYDSEDYAFLLANVRDAVGEDE